MSTNKNDIYHIGLTDNEVLQSREKNGSQPADTPQASLSVEAIFREI